MEVEDQEPEGEEGVGEHVGPQVEEAAGGRGGEDGEGEGDERLAGARPAASEHKGEGEGEEGALEEDERLGADAGEEEEEEELGEPLLDEPGLTGGGEAEGIGVGDGTGVENEL